MPEFRVYREVRRQQKSHEWSMPEPTLVTKVNADDLKGAARKFVDTRGNIWREAIIEVNRYQADVWLRQYTKSGRYKGETHFMIYSN